MNYKKALLPAFLAFSIGLTGCSAGNETQSGEASRVLTAVEATTVGLDTIKKEMVYAGQVEPDKSVSIISKITGKVSDYYFEVGDSVNEGDVLFKLDEKDIQDQITQLQAQINSSNQSVRTAQNAVTSVTGGQYQSQILQQESAIESYDTQLANADTAIGNAQLALDNAEKALDTTQKNYDNTKALFDIDAVSQSDFDQVDLLLTQAKIGYEQAKNAYEQALTAKEQLESNKKTAEESLDLTRGQITEDSRRSAQLALDSARAGVQAQQVQLDLAKETLNDTNVTAPMSGIVSVRNAKRDEYVSSQMAAYTIIDIDKVNVKVRVSELLINSIYVGQEVDVLISSISGDLLRGKIKTISPAADQTGTFPVSIELENKDHEIKPGMFAEVRFVRELSENTVVVERNTVLSDENNAYVYINDNGTARKITVETGIDNGQHIEIISGVQVGEQIITKGHSYISDGEEINVVTVWGE